MSLRFSMTADQGRAGQLLADQQNPSRRAIASG